MADNMDSFRCSICLDLLKDPVTIPCGHSFCMGCIQVCWDQDEQKGIYCCPLCKANVYSRPVLKKNTLLVELVEKLKKTGPQADPPALCYPGLGDLACDFCTGRKQKALKSCLVCLASYCETHLQPHYESPVFKKHKLVKASTQLQEKICSRHDKLLEVFCRTDGQYICCLCSMYEHKGHDTVSVAPERSNKQTQRGFWRGHECRIPTSVNSVDVLTPAEPQTRADFLQYSCQLTLDPNTANRFLTLSEENRKVTRGSILSYPNHPERFSYWPQVLCREGLSGRCYWEVECNGEVFIAVSYKDISRKGKCADSLFGGNNKSWRLDCFIDGYKIRHNNVVTTVSQRHSSIIGMYLDHRAGTLSFYSVSDTMTLLHRVHTTFTQPLYAGFYVICCGCSAKCC